MKALSDNREIRRIAHWLLALVSLLLVLTGYGITEYRTVEGLTFGLLTKSLAFRAHGTLAIVFIILFLLHIYLTWKSKK